MSQMRDNLLIVQSGVAGYPSVRISLTYSQAASDGFATIRASLFGVQSVGDGYSKVRIPLFVVQSVQPAPNEPTMVTATLPGFGNSLADPSIPEAANPASGATPGLAFSMHMKPTFNTRISESVNFNSIRNPLADYARWEFDCPYEFLSDRVAANSSLRKLMDFFCARLGPAMPFLVKNKDFYLAQNAQIGTADGTRTQWDLLRWIGDEYSEPVGQVDLVNTVNVYLTINETVTVPSSGPYTVTVAHSVAFTADAGVTIGGTALTAVPGAPGAMQYSQSGGVYTFNSAQHGATAVIRYRYLVSPSAYTLTLPNKLVFGTAPAAGGTISWDGQFFFTCYFNEDSADFEQFMWQLWTLQSLKFHSELLA